MRLIYIRHMLVRGKMQWGTYGKSGKDPLTWVYLYNLTDEHIQAILDTQHHIQKSTRRLFKRELRLRKRYPEYSIKES